MIEYIIKTAGKYLAEKGQIQLGFTLEILAFIIVGFLLDKKFIVTIILFVISYFWAVVVGEAIKYKSKKEV